jgi:hypothetical protein
LVYPKVFVGSSVEGLDVAHAIETNLQHDAVVRVWDQSVFQLTHSFLESLMKVINEYDFAILVLTPDDIVVTRHKQFSAARDNILFELGLFMAKLGRDRTFLVWDKTSRVKIPSDLYGINLASYDGNRKEGNMVPALSVACSQIRQCLRDVGERKKPFCTNEVSQSLSFECLIKEFEETLSRLESNKADITTQIKEKHDFKRLIDGLFSGILFVSRALAKGFVDPNMYGNLMEYDQEKKLLKVKYFAGPYNEEIICRSFSIEGMNLGVAGEAFSQNKVIVKNNMEELLKVKGEGRLKSMMEIPVEDIEKSFGKTVVLLSIDSAVENEFPQNPEEDNIIKERIKAISKLIQRINRLNEGTQS